LLPDFGKGVVKQRRFKGQSEGFQNRQILLEVGNDPAQPDGVMSAPMIGGPHGPRFLDQSIHRASIPSVKPLARHRSYRPPGPSIGIRRIQLNGSELDYSDVSRTIADWFTGS
jgi:hypothetical protein